MSNEISAVQCACGIRIERQYPAPPAHLSDLLTASHDPMECSRQIGFEGRFIGRQEMADFAVEHLIERKTLGGNEIREIRTNLLDAVKSIALGRVS